VSAWRLSARFGSALFVLTRAFSMRLLSSRPATKRFRHSVVPARFDNATASQAAAVQTSGAQQQHVGHSSNAAHAVGKGGKGGEGGGGGGSRATHPCALPPVCAGADSASSWPSRLCAAAAAAAGGLCVFSSCAASKKKREMWKVLKSALTRNTPINPLPCAD
jgi:hypothetical protein